MGRLDEHAADGLRGIAGKKSVKHVPLLQRATEPALKDRSLRPRAKASTVVDIQSGELCEAGERV